MSTRRGTPYFRLIALTCEAIASKMGSLACLPKRFGFLVVAIVDGNKRISHQRAMIA
jgi:hypothetical protein